MSVKKPPSYSMQVVMGTIFGVLVQWFIPVAIPEDVPVLYSLSVYILFGAMLSFGYYTLFREKVANVKLDDESRISFALIFFMAVGLSLGMGVVKLYQGYSLFGAFGFFGVNIALLAVAYRKLLKLYRGAGPGAGGPG